MTSRPLGLFDQEIRQRKLQALGDPLVELDRIVPWGMFRETLESMRAAGRAPRKGGRPPHDAVRMFKRLCARMDKPRANTAVAHKLARMVYFMLTRGEEYVDQGRERYEAQQRDRSIAVLKRRAAALGFQLAPTASAVT